jgi:hypothetical protein
MMPFAAAKLSLGSTATDASGNYQLSLTSLGTVKVIVEATYPGDSQHWPSSARVAR